MIASLKQLDCYRFLSVRLLHSLCTSCDCDTYLFAKTSVLFLFQIEFTLWYHTTYVGRASEGDYFCKECHSLQ